MTAKNPTSPPLAVSLSALATSIVTEPAVGLPNSVPDSAVVRTPVPMRVTRSSRDELRPCEDEGGVDAVAGLHVRNSPDLFESSAAPYGVSTGATTVASGRNLRKRHAAKCGEISQWRDNISSEESSSDELFQMEPLEDEIDGDRTHPRRTRSATRNRDESFLRSESRLRQFALASMVDGKKQPAVLISPLSAPSIESQTVALATQLHHVACDPEAELSSSSDTPESTFFGKQRENVRHALSLPPPSHSLDGATKTSRSGLSEKGVRTGSEGCETTREVTNIVTTGEKSVKASARGPHQAPSRRASCEASRVIDIPSDQTFIKLRNQEPPKCLSEPTSPIHSSPASRLSSLPTSRVASRPPSPVSTRPSNQPFSLHPANDLSPQPPPLSAEGNMFKTALSLWDPPHRIMTQPLAVTQEHPTLPSSRMLRKRKRLTNVAEVALNDSFGSARIKMEMWPERYEVIELSD
eukprot:Blabericola_migrator_1__4522@NODE_240_length_10958_cov_273_304655_g203_i0_p4_GENE_NODE_240_length_10958_cov_273_304655_g203_i0NODE_240_length_10958_cov_273_304655_g203_i0_p4_ORF_typecomplete_len467_score49_56_NODE_240_length_10958_cov_273_304655_g203_i056317031